MSKVLGYLIGQLREFSGLRVAIPDKGLVIGRDPKQVDVVFDHTMISRRHAQIAPGKEGKLYLIDLQSRNGTHVNGRRITAPVALAAGDKLDFGGEGKSVFVFETADTTAVSNVLKEAFGETVASVEWKVGDTILDLYEVIGLLGQGGFGKVYKVHHKGCNMDLAVKSLKPELFEDEKSVENFIREAETWVNLDLHPNIVQCHYVRTIGGIPRIFAEYVPGGTLAEWIHHRRLTRLDQILDVAIQVAWGLHAAHEKGLVHQDVKPLNVLMTPEGVAKISDFGLARAKAVSQTDFATADGNLVTMAGKFTIAYCSPEQAKGERLSRKTDIWSWAVSVLEMFTGGVVWQNGLRAPQFLKAYRSLLGPKFVTKMPKDLAKLLEQCLSVRPDARPKDMHEIGIALQNVHYSIRGQPYLRPEPKQAEHLADGLNNRALSLMDLGKTEQANQLWQEALRLNPEHLESVYNFGLHQWRIGRTDDFALSMQLREAGVKAAPWLVASLSAQVEIESGDVEAAVNLLDALSSADCQNPEVVMLRTMALRTLPSSQRCLRIFEEHTEGVRSVCLSEDSRFALSGSLDKSLRLWELASGTCVRLFQGHTGEIKSVFLSGDGRFALSGSSDSTLRLWDVSSGRCLQTFEGHTDSVNSVCLSDNTRHALSGGADGTLRLWELTTGHCFQTFEGHGCSVSSVCLSEHSRYALSGSWGETIRLWDIANGCCTRVFQGPADWALCVCLSRDGRHAVSGHLDKSVRLWEVATGRCMRTFEGHTGRINSLCLTADGRHVLSAGDDKTIRLWNAASGRCLRTFEGHDGPVDSVCLSKNSRVALSGSWDKTLRLWDVARRTGYIAPWIMSRAEAADKLFAVKDQYEELLEVAQEAMSNGDLLNAANAIRRARALPGCDKAETAMAIWQALYTHLPKSGFAGGWLERTFEEHSGWVCSVCLSVDGRYAVSANSAGPSAGDSVRLWDTRTGCCLRSFVGHEGAVSSVCLSEDGHRALSGSWDNTLRLWDVASGQCLRSLQGHKGGVNIVCLSGDGRYALSGSLDNTLRLWEVATGCCLRTLAGHLQGVTTACLSRDGCYALSGSVDATLRLWTLGIASCVRTFEGHKGPVYCVCLSSDGGHALSGSSDNTVRWWDVATGRCLGTLEGHSGMITSVCLTDQGRYAVSASADTTVRLWEVASGRCLRVFEGHTKKVDSVCVSRDACHVLSGGGDETVRLWTLDWELENRVPADWDEGARPYLRTFLVIHRPYAGELPVDRQPTGNEITLALTRRGKPVWSEKDFQGLLYTLGCAGYGWLRPEGVRCELERMASKRV